jgi:acyl-CoA synthetase (AMP-forming)/AMP-acid ligase II
LSHQKIPRYFKFVKSYPLTATGKVQKFRLREQAVAELGLEVDTAPASPVPRRPITEMDE